MAPRSLPAEFRRACGRRGALMALVAAASLAPVTASAGPVGETWGKVPAQVQTLSGHDLDADRDGNAELDGPLDEDLCRGHDDRVDQDGDGAPDGCDDDRDGDGHVNRVDVFPDDATRHRIDQMIPARRVVLRAGDLNRLGPDELLIKDLATGRVASADQKWVKRANHRFVIRSDAGEGTLRVDVGNTSVALADLGDVDLRAVVVEAEVDDKHRYQELSAAGLELDGVSFDPAALAVKDFGHGARMSTVAAIADQRRVARIDGRFRLDWVNSNPVMDSLMLTVTFGR